MKKISLLFISLACSINAYAIDNENDYVNQLATSVNYANQNTIWPGFAINRPLMMQLKDTHHGYAVNLLPTNPHWKKITVDNLPIYYLENDEYQLEQYAGDFLTAYANIDDQPVTGIVFEPQKFNVFNALSKLIASEFAHYSYTHFKLDWINSDYDGFNQLTNVKLAYLETAALKNYLTSDSGQSENALRDALAIHQYRSGLMSQSSFIYEEGQQALQGSNDYVGFKSVSLNNKDFIQNVSAISCSQSVDDIYSCMDSNLPGISGAIYEYALDQIPAANAWRTQVRTQSPTLLLSKYYPMSEKEVADRTKNAMQNTQYEFDKIDQNIDAVLKPRLQEMTALQDKYNSQDGIEVGFNARMLFYVEHADEAYRVSNYERLYVNLTGGGGLLVSTDPSSSLSVSYDKTPLTYSKRIKLSSDTKVIIDGQEKTLGDIVKAGEKVSSKNVLIKNSQFAFETKNWSTELSVVDGKIAIETFYGPLMKKHLLRQRESGRVHGGKLVAS